MKTKEELAEEWAADRLTLQMRNGQSTVSIRKERIAGYLAGFEAGVEARGEVPKPTALTAAVLDRWRDFVTWDNSDGFPLARLMQPEVKVLLKYIDDLRDFATKNASGAIPNLDTSGSKT